MFVYSDIQTDIQDAILDDSQETAADILRWANGAIRELCGRYRWPTLRDTKELTPNASGELYLPPLASKHWKLYSSDKDIRFYQVRDNLAKDAVAYYYQPDGMRVTEGASYSGTCTQGSTTVSLSGSPDLSGVETGEAVMFEGISDMFEVTAVDDTADTLTIWPAFPGATDTYTVSYQPPGQRRIVLYSPDGSLYTSDVLLEYYRRHPVLTGDNSIVYPDFRSTMYYMILKKALEQEKYVTDSQRLYEDLKQALDADVNNDDENEPPLVNSGMPGHPPAFAMTRRRGNRSYASERNW